MSDSFGEWAQMRDRRPMAAVLGNRSLARQFTDRTDGWNWPVGHLRDPARELTFAASASSANLRFGRRGLNSATGQLRPSACSPAVAVYDWSQGRADIARHRVRHTGFSEGDTRLTGMPAAGGRRPGVSFSARRNSRSLPPSRITALSTESAAVSAAAGVSVVCASGANSIGHRSAFAYTGTSPIPAAATVARTSRRGPVRHPPPAIRGQPSGRARRGQSCSDGLRPVDC